ncbi:MAG: hypothetical protein C5B50_28365 [Verrucomicrobia bacterium]|nr:MAG: hypothetical protein C5B50_28365 [Verrucomicrobiota bacterium]
MVPMQKPQLIAVDTNILMRLADGHEPTTDAWQLIKRRVHPLQFVVSPTVLRELASKISDDPDPQVRQGAQTALRELRPRWGMQPTPFNAVQEAVAVNAAARLQHSGLIPEQERNDALIVAESAVLECILLVSRDSHLLDIDFEKLTFVFRELDLSPPVISSPEKLLKTFYI